MTVGYHAPPPGARSGVADYAETLRRELTRFGHIETNSTKADIHLYHLGNNRLHEHIYRNALARPGVAVLHDAVLHHLMLGTLTREQYIAEWVYNYGEWRRDLGEELWRDRARAAFDSRYFQFPMLRRIVERSLAVIVHNPGAAAIARAHGATRVWVIPHFSNGICHPDIAETARFRERIGISTGATLFGVFGYLREPKRVIQCIHAFNRLHAIRSTTALLLAGETASPDLERFLRNEPIHPNIRRVGHLAERNFIVAAAAVDCGLNLRYPGAGETSGVAVRLMSLAKPVVVTNNAENSDFPESAVLRVDAGVAETAELFDHMILVAEFPGVASEIGRQAQRHIEKIHSLKIVAREYWDSLCTAAS